MKLTQQQLADLKALEQMPWFKVLVEIEKEARIKLWNDFLDMDLSNEDNLKILRENQIYIKARKDFLNTYKRYTGNTITEANI